MAFFPPARVNGMSVKAGEPYGLQIKQPSLQSTKLKIKYRRHPFARPSFLLNRKKETVASDEGIARKSLFVE